MNDLLVRCFNKDVKKRPNADILRTHPWFTKVLPASVLEKVITSLVKFFLYYTPHIQKQPLPLSLLSQRKSGTGSPAFSVSDLVDTVKSFNVTDALQTLQPLDLSSEDDTSSHGSMSPSPPPRSAGLTKCPSMMDMTPTARIGELSRTVETLQAKLKKKKQKLSHYKKLIEKLSTKCAQQQQALVSRNADSKTLQECVLFLSFITF